MVTHIGNYKGKVQCADGTKTVIIMKNVKVALGLVKNLFSLSTVMRNDWDLLTDTTDEMKVTEIISSTAIATIATKRVIKKLIAGQNSGTMPTMKKRNMHL